MAFNCKVLIIGMGPSGMMLANELQKYNIDYIILDKRGAISNITRAVNITPSTIAALWYSLQSQMLSNPVINDNIELYCNNQIVSTISYDDQKFPFKKFIYLPQPLLEKVLYEKLVNKNTVILENTELLDITKKNNQYQSQCLYNEQQLITINSEYVIGCDGNSSFVRKWICAEDEEEDYQSSFILYDFMSASLCINVARYYLFEYGYIIIAPISINTFRLIISLPEVSISEDNKNEVWVTSIVKKYCNISIQEDMRIIWFTSAGFRHRIAQKCIQDKSILVGDSFHVFSPIGGLNMNAGLQDAINLGWKLAYVINKVADESLLESYALERKFSVNMFRDNTKMMTNLVVNRSTNERKSRKIDHIKNGIFMDREIPYMLSGYSFYNFATTQANKLFLCGYHISEFIADEKIYISLCMKINNTKFNLIINNPNKYESDNLTHVVVEDNLELNDCFIFLRPDGYILFNKSINKLSELNNDLLQFLKGNKNVR